MPSAAARRALALPGRSGIYWPVAGAQPVRNRTWKFAGLAASEDFIARAPDVIDAAVRADPALAREVGRQKFPPDAAALIAAVVARDTAFYQPAISEDAVGHLNDFARSIGHLAGPAAYDRVVAARCRKLWTAG